MNRQLVKVENPQAVGRVSSPKVIEIHSVVQKPIKLNAILVSLLVLVLALLAFLPVRSRNSISYVYYDRPLIVWVMDNIQASFFIYDPTQPGIAK